MAGFGFRDGVDEAGRVVKIPELSEVGEARWCKRRPSSLRDLKLEPMEPKPLSAAALALAKACAAADREPDARLGAGKFAAGER